MTIITPGREGALEFSDTSWDDFKALLEQNGFAVPQCLRDSGYVQKDGMDVATFVTRDEGHAIRLTGYADHTVTLRDGGALNIDAQERSSSQKPTNGVSSSWTFGR